MSLDWDLFKPEKGYAGSRANLALSSEGYTQITEGDGGEDEADDGNANSIITQALFGYTFFRPDYRMRGTEYRAKYDRLYELTQKPEDLTAAEEAEYDELTAFAFGSKGPQVFRFAIVDVHANVETDDEFDNEQWVGGAGVTTDTDLFAIRSGGDFIRPHALLDLPFEAMRDTHTPWNAKPAVIYLGLDYVMDSDLELRQALTDDDEFARLTGQVAWHTVVGRNILLNFKWRVYYELDAPAAVEDADKDLTSFFEASAEIPLLDEKNTRFVIKYTDGELPPTLEEASSVSVGLKFLH